MIEDVSYIGKMMEATNTKDNEKSDNIALLEVGGGSNVHMPFYQSN